MTGIGQTTLKIGHLVITQDHQACHHTEINTTGQIHNIDLNGSIHNIIGHFHLGLTETTGVHLTGKIVLTNLKTQILTVKSVKWIIITRMIVALTQSQETFKLEPDLATQEIEVTLIEITSLTEILTVDVVLAIKKTVIWGPNQKTMEPLAPKTQNKP